MHKEGSVYGFPRGRGGGAKESSQGGGCGRAVVPSKQVGTEAARSAASGWQWVAGPPCQREGLRALLLVTERAL